MCVTRNIETDEVLVWKEASGLQKFLASCDLIIGHNIIGFDAPVLRKVWSVTMKPSQVYDTLVSSRLLNPSLEGGHSLDAWGTRLGFPKMPYKEIWSWMTGNSYDPAIYSETGPRPNQSYRYYAGREFDELVIPLMEEYCIQDTKVTQELYNHLVSALQSQKFSQESIKLEHTVQKIITKQEANGFKLDERKAGELLVELKAKLDAIQTRMQSLFPPKVESNRISKLGKPLNDIVTPFNPGSRKQIAERLMEKGWKPSKMTEKGS